jgi:hypothetical protein
VGQTEKEVLLSITYSQFKPFLGFDGKEEQDERGVF